MSTLKSRKFIEEANFQYILRKFLFNDLSVAAHQFLLQPIGAHPKAEEAFGVWGKNKALVMCITINTDGLFVYSGPPDSTLVFFIPVANIQNYPRVRR